MKIYEIVAGYKLSTILKILLVAILIYSPIFGHLSRLPIRIWDESRLAINAYEMYRDGGCLVTTFEGKPDHWNTKPPLLIWLQVLAMKALGVGELAVRLPSAFAAFFTVILLLFFGIRYLQNFWYGFVSMLVLITTHGYINIHCTRTGDYDALLVLFTTCSSIFLFLYLDQPNRKYIYFFAISSSLAVLTKSVAGLLFFPAYLIFILIEGKLVSLLKNKDIYFAFLIFISPIYIYYLSRELIDPGYLNAVWENELGGRYLQTIENHKHPFWYYYSNFVQFQSPFWIYLVPCGWAIGLFARDVRLKKLSIYLIILLLTYLLIISVSGTKLEWYDAPTFPFMALSVSIFINLVFDALKKARFSENFDRNPIPYIFLFLIFAWPYKKIVEKTYLPVEYPWDVEFYELGYYLQKVSRGQLKSSARYLAFDGYNAHNLFYLYMIRDHDKAIDFVDWTKLQAENVVIAYQPHVIQYINEHYKVEVLDTKGKVQTFKINERLP